MSVLESISTINSLVRTLLILAVVGGAGMLSFEIYQSMHEREAEQEELKEAQTRRKAAEEELQTASKQLASVQANLKRQTAQIAELKSEAREQELRYRRLDTAMRLLKVDRRAARLTVIKQEKDEESDSIVTEIEFVEIDDRGEAVAKTQRRFMIKGDLVYIDSWIVKFDDKYVEQSDLHRSTSLVLFKRIFGDKQRPVDGFALDQKGVAPRVYRRDDQSDELETKIFEDFWSVANDNEKQRALGIRAAHGTADYIKVEPEKSYRVEIRASGDVTIVPDDTPPPNRAPSG